MKEMRMLGINKVTILGNLGQDPELRQTKNGKPVCNFSVATSTKLGDKKETVWHRAVVYGTLAESCKKYLTKGRPVYLEGRLTANSWTDKDGGKHDNMQVTVETLRFLGSRPESASSEEAAPSADDISQDELDAEVPF